MKKYSINFIIKTKNKKILAEVLRRDKDDDVSLCAALNPNCPPEALAETLRRGKDDNVSYYAAENPTYKKYLRTIKKNSRLGRLVSYFVINKKIEIEHPRNWSKQELTQLAQDICNYDGINKLRNWNMNRVEFRTIDEKIVRCKE